MLADAAIHGLRPESWQLDAVRELGRRAAGQGVGARSAVDLYLNASWRLWRQLPVVVRSSDPEKVRRSGEAVLRVLDDAVGVLVDGHQSERREMIRHEEALRREFIDDLLRGDADVAGMVQRAEPFGIDLGRPHHVALAVLRSGEGPVDRAATALERAVVDRFGDRDVLVATKEGLLVVLAPAELPEAEPAAGAAGPLQLGELMHAELNRLPRGRPWQVSVGRPHPGLYGIARSYEEAREALAMARRLQVNRAVVGAHELLVYRVLLRDQPAMVDLVQAVLQPLTRARGGAEPLLVTLAAYFDTGGVATEAARRLHVSVRTVTYRLQRIKTLTGYDAADPTDRFTLQAATLGARALNWPQQPLPIV
jgi:sugar diacid utilization regulator